MNRIFRMVSSVCLAALVGGPMIAGGQTNARIVGREGLTIDLSPWFAKKFDGANYKGPAKELPTIDPVFDGLRFDLRGQVALFGQTSAERNQVFPVAVEAGPVNAKFDELHLVHHTQWPDAEGETVGRVRLHYEDNSTHEIEIVYGRQVRDWFFLPSYEVETVSDPESKVIWRDPQRDNNNLKGFRRLWKTRFANPHPDKLVRSLTFRSTRRYAAYSVIAATAANADEKRAVTESIPFDEPPRKFTGRISVTVVNANTGGPVAGAVLDPGTVTKGAGVVCEMLRTDKDGKAEFRYWHEETTSIWFRVMAAGYAATRESLTSALTTGQTTIRLSPGVAIGGTVGDQEGNGISGAFVTASGSSGRDFATFSGLQATTDADGRWEITGIPAAAQSFTINVRALEMPTATFYAMAVNTVPADDRILYADLTNRAARLTVHRGYALKGLVVDDKGEPIKEARILLGQSYYDREKQQTQTDEKGQFEFKNLSSGSTMLTVQANSKKPDVRPIIIRANTPLQKITPVKGHLIAGKVVDGAGQPLAEVAITMNQSVSPRTIRWQGKTKPDGTFRWGAAPMENMQFIFKKEDHVSHGRAIVPDKKPVTIVMPVAPLIEARVLDAASGKAVKQFHFQIGQVHNDGADFFASSRDHTGTDGRLAVKLDEPEGVVLKVRADGYLPVYSPTILAANPPRDLVIRLRQGGEIVGRVVLPDGQPAEGAYLAVLGRGQNLTLSGARFENRLGRGAKTIFIERDGAFRIRPNIEPEKLVAVHELGYGQLDFQSATGKVEVILHPWARVMGRVVDLDGGGAGELVSLTPQETRVGSIRLDWNTYRTQTDKDGYFVILKAPPGRYNVVRLIPINERSWRHAQSVQVTLFPGSVVNADIEIGGRPRPVTGRFAVEPRSARLDWSRLAGRLYALHPIKTDDPTVPKDDNRFRRGAIKGHVQPSYPLKVERNGRFTFERVYPGEYMIMASITPDPTAPEALRSNPFARMNRRIRIPAIRTGGITPYDLGDLKIERLLRAGDPAPDFEVKVNDKKRFRLADHRGKFVLVAFWATWNPAALAEVPNWRKLFDAFEKDERFVMIGLSAEFGERQFRQHPVANDIKWINGIIGPDLNTGPAKAYRVQSVPQAFLIDLDGKIIVTGLRGAQLHEAVARALGAAKPAAKR